MDTDTTELNELDPAGSWTANGHRPELPEVLVLTQAQANRIPSPGTQRALKAETGRSWEALVGPEADAADRFQTMIWIQLRRTIPGLRWEDCSDVDVQVEEGVAGLDPTRLGASESSPLSVASGD